ncbi:universal stress protein [soil metagenome]
MSYKSMVVCLDNSTGSPRVLDFSLELASQYGAHLTGLHLTYDPIIMSDPYAVWAPMMLEWEESAEEKQNIAKEEFYSGAKKAGVNVDWAGYRSSDTASVVAHARANDLAIIAQRNADDISNDSGNKLADLLALKLGRPVLYLPYIGKFSTMFDKVIVAWDGGREAARAMSDALPFLCAAKQVTVLSISEKADLDDDLPDIDIAGYLAKHDVKVDIERNQGVDIDPADWLLSRANELDADLLVMGAYGHNRMTEMVLGGVTLSILRHMTLPVLMSH